MKTTPRAWTLSFAPLVAGLVLVGSTPGNAGSELVQQDGLSPQTVRAEDSAPRASPPAAEPAPAPSTAPILYVPPEIGFPARRMGAGTRGVGRRASLQVLAPDHMGYTSLEQPTLYWYLAEPTTTRIDFTIRDETSVEPLLEIELPAPAHAGIQAVRLADHGVRLRPGTRYLWFVSLVLEPEQRSKDFTVGAWIERRTSDAALGERRAAAGAREAEIYAESGLWYDAIDSLTARVTAAPADPKPRDERAALLDQAGLSQVAAYDRDQVAER